MWRPCCRNWLSSLAHVLEARLTLSTVALPSIHASIPPVFDSIVTAIPKSSSNFCPATSHITHHPFNHFSFLVSDRVMIQRLFQILVVSFSTLLRCPVLHVLRDAYPIVGTFLLDKIKQKLVLICVPWSAVGGSASHSRLVTWINVVLEVYR